MSCYEKKVVYLSYMEKGIKIKSAGYVRIEIRDELFSMDMHVKADGPAEGGRYEITAETDRESVPIGVIYLQNGAGDFTEKYPAAAIGKNDYGIGYEDIRAIKVSLGDERDIMGILMPHGTLDIPDSPAAESVHLPEERHESPKVKEAVVIPIERNGEVQASQRTRRSTEPRQNEEVRKSLEEIRQTPDKWQQLLKNYKQIHPYGDERLYISIEPKDFVILSSEYQHLAHNSFLLHGFYNYRHIILGTEGDAIYLGVPGVFYEREKMVAMMFGFEAFECEGGKAENGKFGYYLKKIKI